MVQRTKYTKFPDFLEFIQGWRRQTIDKINGPFITYNKKVDALEKNQTETAKECSLGKELFFPAWSEKASLLKI